MTKSIKDIIGLDLINWGWIQTIFNSVEHYSLMRRAEFSRSNFSRSNFSRSKLLSAFAWFSVSKRFIAMAYLDCVSVSVYLTVYFSIDVPALTNLRSWKDILLDWRCNNIRVKSKIFLHGFHCESCVSIASPPHASWCVDYFHTVFS